MIYPPDPLMWILAKPDNSSKAASEILRSVFQDEINRWHTRYVALTNKAWAESEKLLIKTDYSKAINAILISQ